LKRPLQKRKQDPARNPKKASAFGEEVTLEFDNARALQALYGGDEKLLRLMERDFGVRITSRDGWLKIQGDDKAVTKARHVFDELRRVVSLGGVIGRDEFLFALEHPEPSEPSVSTPAQPGPDGCSPLPTPSPLEGLYQERIQCSQRKPPVVPNNLSQRDYLRAIDAHDITFGVGPAGTGKTYLAVAKAVAALKTEKVSRIILTRPAVEAGEALGFLPGELQEKILPYLRPLYDALHDMLEPEEIQRAIERNIIEIAPLAYMRGRTLNKAFIILDEAQNTTTEQMFMFLTRIGIGSKCVITGDRTQIDLPKNKPSGLIEAIGALANTPGINFHLFGEKDVVRHPLVRAIITAYKEHRGLQETRI
jgi:phosphate starvation-inducible PhoH-like protein